MSGPSLALLSRLAENRSIPFDPARMPTSRWFEASDGLQLHYLDWPGGQDTAVLLHGGALSAHTFDLLALALGAGVRCIALDLRGHGQSGWECGYEVDRWARDVVELVGMLDIQTVHVAGMSLGGCIAGHAAAGLGDRLGSLTFIDVADQVNFAATARMRTFLKNARPVRRVEDMVAEAMAISAKTDPELMLYRYQSLLKATANGFDWRADRRRPPNFPHMLDKLAELVLLAPAIACPVLVVRGGRSNVFDQTISKRFSGAFPNGRSATVPDAGHNVQEDQPVALAIELRRQFASIER